MLVDFYRSNVMVPLWAADCTFCSCELLRLASFSTICFDNDYIECQDDTSQEREFFSIKIQKALMLGCTSRLAVLAIRRRALRTIHTTLLQYGKACFNQATP